MVSIVIVSHSIRLAEGVRELAEQMVAGQVELALAAGIDDPDNPIGTDAVKVMEAIESVYSEDGVLVLMDLGSALLSAELALELLPPERQAQVYLCEAPLIEGAMAAAVQAAGGGTIQQVMSEARGALAAKQAQLSDAVADTPTELTESAPQPTVDVEQPTTRLTVRNRLGLHARPAAQFVRTANRFTADMMVTKGDRQANAKSINQVATLGVRQGDEIIVSASGPDADAALAAITALADANFGEAEEIVSEAPSGPTPVRATEGDWLAGIAASPGVAVGPVFQYRPRLPDVVTVEVADPVAEGQRLRRALEEARLEIEALRRQAISRVGAAEAAIFEAHALFLQDPDLVDAALATIERERCNAEAAWNRAIEETAAAYRQMEDGYMRARAADVLDAGRRVLRQLMDLTPPSLSFEQPVIVLAADLTPSDTARLDPTAVLGIGTEVGGPTAHSAILARALGIPAVVGLGPALETIPAGQLIALDGSAGRLWPAPDTELLTVMEEKRARWQEVQAAAKRTSRAAAVTQDGRSIEVAANIGGPNDVPIAREYGAEGVGLFRTEFLFLDRETAPSEAEQVEAYRQAAAAMSGWPVIVRTLDVGGDKPLPYADLGREENPFLGWRGIRFCLDRPEIFKPQLRAILRASHDQALKLMFPMIGTLAELRAAKRMLAEARAELDAEGVGYDRQLEVGIMVEVPAAATVADRLASEVDFFSIGTNDLSQYVMAADRGNARVAPLADAFQPAVLRLIQRTVEAAHAADIWVGMCGELAGNALATPLLVGLGLDELSMNAPAIPAVKERIRSLHLSEARQLAPAVLDLDSADAVVSYLESL